MDLKQLLNQTTINDTMNDETLNGNDENNNDDVNDNENVVNDGVNDGVNDDVNDGVNDGVNDDVDGVDDDENVVNDDEDKTNEKSEIDERFKVPWNKLEKGNKLNRILIFIKQETEEKELSTTLSKELKNILFNACDRGLFNKVSDVSYNIETGLIESFKCLEFNESSKKYKLKSSGTKNRSVSKSRSNIDRLAKKK
jgi:hypothetical protein